MKKVNPKVIGLVVLLLGSILAGGIAVQDGFGDPADSNGGGDVDTTGFG